jgi:hypothetical protein
LRTDRRVQSDTNCYGYGDACFYCHGHGYRDPDCYGNPAKFKYANSDGDCGRHCHRDACGNTKCDRNSYRNPDSHRRGHSNGDADCYGRCQCHGNNSTDGDSYGDRHCHRSAYRNCYRHDCSDGDRHGYAYGQCDRYVDGDSWRHSYSYSHRYAGSVTQYFDAGTCSHGR